MLLSGKTVSRRDAEKQREIKMREKNHYANEKMIQAGMSII
jgi:hypothetical protein